MQKHALVLMTGCLVTGAFAVASCADGYDQLAHSDHSHAEGVAQVALTEQTATVKPGANVTFSHEFVQNTIVGGPQIVRLTIDEAYDSGQLEVEIVKNDGMNIAQTRKTMVNLALADRHTWDVQFETPQEGRFYIGILATIKNGSRTIAHRAYSIPVYAGDVTGFKREAQGFGLDKTPNGQPIVTMRAQETIEQ